MNDESPLDKLVVYSPIITHYLYTSEIAKTYFFCLRLASFYLT